jgi:hypothetical protein
MMRPLQVIKEILLPGKSRFKAQLLSQAEEEKRIINCLHQLDNRVTRSINAATDRAAEF